MSSRSLWGALALAFTLSLLSFGCGDGASPPPTDAGTGSPDASPDAALNPDGGGLAALGTACDSGALCASGECVDGVCCERACDGTCEACVSAATDEADGTCAPILVGEDPEDECAAGPCGAGFCNGGGACQAASAGTLCRASAGSCDVAETCDGASSACPVDALHAQGTECRPAAGDCDVAESCDGLDPACPSDSLVPAATTCRASVDDCDAEEACDGVAPTCPADGFQPAGTLCRDAANGCDAQDYCSGSSVVCADDILGGAVGPCAPYRCATAAPMCGSSCSTNADCATGAACMTGACVPARRVFVTSTMHRPTFGSLGGADAVCQARAQAANLPGVFRAWLSDDTTSAAARLEHFNGPYYRFYNGVPEVVADNWADLTDGSLDLTMGITEFGQVRNANQGPGIAGDSAWTGTAPNGAATALNCSNWTAGTQPTTATVGTNGGNTGNWTSNGALYCQYSLRLYCIEQNPTPPD